MNDVGALECQLHHAGSLIPSSAGGGRRDEAEMLVGGLCSNGGSTQC